jgi:ceramide glucosyltransferase
LVDAPFSQPLGERQRGDVWDRQVRWARLRRDSFRSFYWLEAGAGAALPLIAAVVIALISGQSVIVAAATFLTLWYGAEMLLAAIAGWHLPMLYPLHAMLRDAMLPILWIEGWRAGRFVWRGNAMNVNEGRVAPN